MDEPTKSPLAAIVENLGLETSQRHVFFCGGNLDPAKDKRCCSIAEGTELWDYFKKRVKEAGIAGKKGATLMRHRCNCLQVCSSGPIMVVYPEGVWYHSCTREAIDRIVSEHLVGGRPVEEFMFARHELSPTTAQE